MKKVIAIVVMPIALQAATLLAGEQMVSSKQVITPPPAPPISYFRGNEFDLGAFATYVTGTNGGGTRQRVFDNGNTFTLSSSGTPDGWGGGMDFTYYFPWKYAGVRFQGAGVEINSGNVTVTGTNGFRTRSGSGSAAAGVLTGDFIMRLPLDDFWPSVHLAPYIFGGFGGVFTGAGGNTINTPYARVNQRVNNASSNVSNDRFLGNVGGGVEYRFTPHLGIFGEAGYNFVEGGNYNFNSSVKNFVQVNFGIRWAF
ncbi:MAG: hypothetical protein JO076_07020 [Verrucomicrobia bacterium]|nr:hypothetical protein [Verrucomicrobiota bacterium]